MTDILYGRNPVLEALRGPRNVHRLWAVDTTGYPNAEPVDDVWLRELCGSPDHQGVCAEVDPYQYADPSVLLKAEDALVVVLDQVQDPRNLGAVCRVAECAGAAGVVIPERRSAAITPAAAKTSAGAVEHLPVARVRNVADWLGEAKEAGAWAYGADARARTSWTEPDYSGRVVLVLGSEGSGLRPRVAGACDDLVALPTKGQVGSLNVSAAASALVYGVLQSRLQAVRPLDGAP